MMSKLVCFSALVVALLVWSSPAQAQGQGVPACVDDLGPCQRFVTSETATPTTQCCQPFARLLQNDLDCLCSIFRSAEVSRTLQINTTVAATLPSRCGLEFDLVAACQVSLAPSGAPMMSPFGSPIMSPSAASAPALVMTPSEGPSMTPGSSDTAPAPGLKTGGASNVAWTGSAIMGPLLVWAALMFY